MVKNARFWIYWNNSHVKITLARGESIRLHSFRYTEEGWDSVSESFTHEGDCVVSETCNSGRDCDGMIEHCETYQCSLANLQGNPADEYGPARPQWEKIDAWHYDEYASMANY